MLKRTVCIVVSAWVLLLSGYAAATCYWSCTVDFMTEGCEDPDATFAASDPIYVWGQCKEFCCAPPPSEDEEQECTEEGSFGADPSDVTVLDSSLEPVPGHFTVSEHVCEGENLLLFDGELAPGDYVVKLKVEFDDDYSGSDKSFSVTEGAAGGGGTDDGEGDDDGGCSVSVLTDGGARALPGASLLMLLLVWALLPARARRPGWFSG